MVRPTAHPPRSGTGCSRSHSRAHAGTPSRSGPRCASATASSLRRIVLVLEPGGDEMSRRGSLLKSFSAYAAPLRAVKPCQIATSIPLSESIAIPASKMASPGTGEVPGQFRPARKQPRSSGSGRSQPRIGPTGLISISGHASAYACVSPGDWTPPPAVRVQPRSSEPDLDPAARIARWDDRDRRPGPPHGGAPSPGTLIASHGRITSRRWTRPGQPGTDSARGGSRGDAS